MYKSPLTYPAILFTFTPCILSVTGIKLFCIIMRMFFYIPDLFSQRFLKFRDIRKLYLEFTCSQSFERMGPYERNDQCPRDFRQ